MPGPLDFSLQGKVVVQCGGSGALGHSLTSALTQAGADLIVASRDPAGLAKSIAAERSAGGKVESAPVDIASESSILALRERVLGARGRIDGVVFNSVIRPMRTMADPLASWEASMAVNATGFFALVRAMADAMADRGSGSIVAIASIQGMVGANLWLYEDDPAMVPPPDYFFHKGGMINLVRYFASRYGPRGVRVNTVCPGGISHPERAGSPTFLPRYSAMTMLGRPALPEEVSAAAVFLLSDAACGITAVNLPIDGGYTGK